MTVSKGTVSIFSVERDERLKAFDFSCGQEDDLSTSFPVALESQEPSSSTSTTTSSSSSSAQAAAATGHQAVSIPSADIVSIEPSSLSVPTPMDSATRSLTSQTNQLDGSVGGGKVDGSQQGVADLLGMDDMMMGDHGSDEATQSQGQSMSTTATTSSSASGSGSGSGSDNDNAGGSGNGASGSGTKSLPTSPTRASTTTTATATSPAPAVNKFNFGRKSKGLCCGLRCSAV